MICCGLVWYGMVWYDMIWFGSFGIVIVFPPSLHLPLLPSLPLLLSSFNIPKHSTRVEWLERWKGWPERAAPSPSGVLGNIDGRGKEGKEGGGMDVGRGGCVSSVPRESVRERE